MLDPAKFQPKAEPAKIFRGDAAGIGKAATELRKSREPPEAPITKRGFNGAGQFAERMMRAARANDVR
jgi:hypothetical protein